MTRMSEVLGITPAVVSQHLKVLKFARLVRSERKGYWRHYDIDPPRSGSANSSLASLSATRPSI